jgi:hypothetical protein
MTTKLLALYGLKWNPFAPEIPPDVSCTTRRSSRLRAMALPALGKMVGREGGASAARPSGTVRPRSR